MKKLIAIFSTLLALSLLTGCGVTEQLGKDCGGDLKELCHNIFGGRIDNNQDDRLDDHDGEIDELKKRVAVLEQGIADNKAELTLLGNALAVQGSNLQNQINTINSSLSALQSADANQNSLIAQLQLDLSDIIGDVSILQGQFNTLNSVSIQLVSDVSTLQSSLANTNATVNSLSSQTNLNTSDIAILQSLVAGLQGSMMSVNSNVTTLQSQINTALIQLAIINGYTHIVSIKDPCGQQGSWNEVLLKLSSGKYLASFSENANGKNTRFVVLQDGTYMTTDDTNCHFTVSGNGTVISNEHN